MISLPRVEGGFACIDADPAWPFTGYAPPKLDDRDSRAIERHYATMTIDEIAAMPVREIAARDAHLFLWGTWPQLPAVLRVMSAWGFEYSGSAFVWPKLRRGIAEHQLCVLDQIEREFHLGLGHTTRKNTEFCLLGRRGNAKRLAADVRELIIAPVREHSRKPDEAHRRMERYCAGPRLQLFGRESRPGWTVWGNEATKFDQVEA